MLVVIAASIVGFAIIAQLLADQSDYVITTYAIIVDYAIYFFVLPRLFYIDNMMKYRLESDGINTVKLRHNLKKLIISLGMS